MTEPDFIKCMKKSVISLNGNENERPSRYAKKKIRKSLCADCESMFDQMELKPAILRERNINESFFNMSMNTSKSKNGQDAMYRTM